MKEDKELLKQDIGDYEAQYFEIYLKRLNYLRSELQSKIASLPTDKYSDYKYCEKVLDIGKEGNYYTIGTVYISNKKASIIDDVTKEVSIS